MSLGTVPRRAAALAAPAARRGSLELVADVAPDGRTYLSRRRQRFPLRLTAPLRLDPGRPEMAFLYVQNPTGGTFEDDDLLVSLRARGGARVHLTTQAATKVCRAGEGCARQRVELAVAEGAFVEYVPDLLIPHAGARFEQELVADVEPGGRLIASELVAPGRVAHAEAFEYTSLSLTTRIRVEARETAVDTVVLAPARRDPRGPGILGGRSYLGSLFTVAPREDADALASAVSGALAGMPGCTAATGTLPSGAGVLTRVLAGSRIHTERALRAAWTAARVALLGAPPPRRRK
jgi:urease accessory protein